MQPASINEIKSELKELDKGKLVELLLTLAKYKKDNKEYLGYLLFEAHDKQAFAEMIRGIIDAHMEEHKQVSTLYYVKKGLRKTLRLVNKYCRYAGDKALSAEMHIHFCRQLKNSGIPFHKNKLIVNLYAQELKKINSLVKGLHEDLQEDYRSSIEEISQAL